MDSIIHAFMDIHLDILDFYGYLCIDLLWISIQETLNEIFGFGYWDSIKWKRGVPHNKELQSV